MTVFIKKCEKKTSHTFFGSFGENLSQSLTNRGTFTNFKIIVTMSDKKLLQSVIGITQSVKKTFLQNVTGTKSVTVITK